MEKQGALLEHLDIAKICSEGGDKLIWGVLDEKYGPQQIDLLQEALRGFFYDLTVKQGESFRQFQARFTAARRKLEEEKVSLPEVVLGYMLMKKLKLETQEESMLLTTTGGDLSLAKIEKAIQSVFPDGKGHLSKQNAKEVFSTEISQEQEEDDLQNVMNLMADEIQAREEWDEEEILEAFESYSEVRRKLAEQKNPEDTIPLLRRQKVKQNLGRSVDPSEDASKMSSMPESWPLEERVSHESVECKEFYLQRSDDHRGR